MPSRLLKVPTILYRARTPTTKGKFFFLDIYQLSIIGGSKERLQTYSNTDSPYEARYDVVILYNGTLVILENATLSSPPRSVTPTIS